MSNGNKNPSERNIGLTKSFAKSPFDDRSRANAKTISSQEPYGSQSHSGGGDNESDPCLPRKIVFDII